MAKLTLADVSNILGNPTSAANTINNNSNLIEQALENTLSRDGTSPNQMNSDLDMNNNDVLNVDNIHAESFVLNGQLLVPSDVSQLPPSVMTKSVYDQYVVTNDSYVVNNTVYICYVHCRHYI